jgi:hypothetical protein
MLFVFNRQTPPLFQGGAGWGGEMGYFDFLEKNFLA